MRRCWLLPPCLCSFFFQAEDGIRDLVTGVQTCALPICWKPRPRSDSSSFPVFSGVTCRLLQLIGDLPVADQCEACVVRGPQRASRVVMKRPVSTIVNGAADQTAEEVSVASNG